MTADSHTDHDEAVTEAALAIRELRLLDERGQMDAAKAAVDAARPYIAEGIARAIEQEMVCPCGTDHSEPVWRDAREVAADIARQAGGGA